MKEFKFDEQGRLIHDDSLGTPTSEDYKEIRRLEAKYNRTIPDVNKTDDKAILSQIPEKFKIVEIIPEKESSLEEEVLKN